MTLKHLFQSTRPQGARRGPGECVDRYYPVSIHAPAGGATHPGSYRAPALASFNPRARRGRDQKIITMNPEGIPVSIHAPAGGATQRISCRLIATTFQSTRPQGARRRTALPADRHPWFQSTRPQGARPIIKRFHYYEMAGFNPRARRGRDVLYICKVYFDC